MKALVLKAANTPFELTEVPDPRPGPGEAVARVFACGAGLTIQHYKAGRTPCEFPRIIGHEICGEIVETGAGVTHLKTGDPVTAYYYLSCMHCRYCVSGLEPLCENLKGNVGKECDGGYAEYIKLPAHLFLKLPDGLDHRRDAAQIGVVTDAIATPYKVLGRAGVKPGETVAVFGAGGGLGIQQVMMAKWARARVIAVDRAANKFDAVRQAGADEVVDASSEDVVEALMELTGGAGLDVAIDYVSTRGTLEQAAKSLGKHGRLVTLGGAGQEFTANSKTMLYHEQSLLGSRYVSRAQVMESLDLCASRAVWPIVTDIQPMEKAEEVHERVEKGEVIGRAALLIG